MHCFLYSSLGCRDFWVGKYFFCFVLFKPLDLTQAQNIYYALLHFFFTNECVALPFALSLMPTLQIFHLICCTCKQYKCKVWHCCAYSSFTFSEALNFTSMTTPWTFPAYRIIRHNWLILSFDNTLTSAGQ